MDWTKTIASRDENHLNLVIWSAFCKRFYGSTHRLYNIEPPQLCKQAISASPAERFRGILKCWLHGYWLSASSTNNHINMIYVPENYISMLKRHIIMRLLSTVEMGINIIRTSIIVFRHMYIYTYLLVFYILKKIDISLTAMWAFVKRTYANCSVPCLN